MAWFSFRVREVLVSMPQAAPCRCPRGALLGLPVCHLSSDGKCAKKQSLRAGSDTVPRTTESPRKTRKTCISRESKPGRIHGSSAVYHYRALSAQPATASAEPGSEARCARARSIAAAARSSRSRADGRCDARRCGPSEPNAAPSRAGRGCRGNFLGLTHCQRSCADNFGAWRKAVRPACFEPTPFYGMAPSAAALDRLAKLPLTYRCDHACVPAQHRAAVLALLPRASGLAGCRVACLRGTRRRSGM